MSKLKTILTLGTVPFSALLGFFAESDAKLSETIDDRKTTEEQLSLSTLHPSIAKRMLHVIKKSDSTASLTQESIEPLSYKLSSPKGFLLKTTLSQLSDELSLVHRIAKKNGRTVGSVLISIDIPQKNPLSVSESLTVNSKKGVHIAQDTDGSQKLTIDTADVSPADLKILSKNNNLNKIPTHKIKTIQPIQYTV